MNLHGPAEEIQILCTIFMIMGGLMLLAVYWLYSRRKKLIQLGYNATGKVVDIIPVSDGSAGGGFVYAPVIEFKTYMNETIQKKYPMGTSSRSLKPGDEVELYYHPDKPRRFVLKNDKAMRLLFTMLSIIGGAFFLFGLIVMLS